MQLPQSNYAEPESDRSLSQIDFFKISELVRFFDIAKPHRDESSRYYWFIERGGGFAFINEHKFRLRPGTFIKVPANSMVRFQLTNTSEGMVFKGADVFMRTRVAPGLYTDGKTYQDFYFKPFVYHGLEDDGKTAKRQQIAREMKIAASRLGRGCDAAVMGYIFVILSDGGVPNVSVDGDESEGVNRTV